MHRLKFWLTALFGAVAVIFGEAFVRRLVAASLCGTLALNSSLCVSSLTENKSANTSSAKGSHASNTEILIPKQRSLILSQKPNYKFSSDAEQNVYNATMNGDLSQYDTIKKRNAYYEYIHNVLQSCPGTKGIQFFAAAENVTSVFGVGIVDDTFLRNIFSDHSEATKQVYKDINAALFKRNAEIAKSLLEKCKPVQPEHLDKPCFEPHPANSGFDFDIAMTEFEQNLVQRQFIEPYQDDPAYKTVFEEINNDLNFKGIKRTIAENSLAWTLSKAGNWAKDALGVSQLEYKSLNHRLALAQALIHIKHDKTKDDFKKNWNTKKYPDACPNECHRKSTDKQSGPCPPPNAEGKSYGDPHLITFDGFRYSFQTVGEFIMTQSKDGKFKVQTRQAPVNRNLSMNSAVAMKVGRVRVAFYTKNFPDKNTSNPLRVNGKAVSLENDKLNLPGGGLIVKTGSNYAVSFPTGEKVFLASANAGDSTYFNVSPFVYKQVDLYEGLLGNVNGNAKDELQIRGGQNLSATQSTYGDVKQILSGTSSLRLPSQLNVAERMYFDQVNKDFGNSWRVKPEESLFDYPPEKTTKDYTDRSFPEQYLKLDMLSSQQLEQARKECTARKLDAAQMEGCIFDVGFTGFSEFAYTTAQINSYADTVNQLFPGLDIPKIPRVEDAVDRVINQVKPKVCLPFVGCL